MNGRGLGRGRGGRGGRGACGGTPPKKPKMVAARDVREWFAFFGGEESGISLDLASKIWDAAIKSVEKSRTSTNNRRDACRWKYVEDGYYHTACGEDWIFPEGSPVENGLVFCPVCGKRASVR